jgi:hypothetical protein
VSRTFVSPPYLPYPPPSYGTVHNGQVPVAQHLPEEMTHEEGPPSSPAPSPLEEDDNVVTVGDVLLWVMALLRTVTRHVRARTPPWTIHVAQVCLAQAHMSARHVPSTACASGPAVPHRAIRGE